MCECVFHPQLKLQQLQQQCEPVSLPDATCRYRHCLQYHASTSIIVEDPGIRVGDGIFGLGGGGIMCVFEGRYIDKWLKISACLHVNILYYSTHLE